MDLRFYQVDSFSDRVFGGNPAGVCILEGFESWPGSELLLKIAQENNIAETVYCLPRSAFNYDIRWFTPEIEMDLCGHATLAAAHVIFTYYETDASKLTFHSEFSGQLGAERVPASAIDGPLLIQMRLPCRPPVKVEDTTKMPGEIITGIGKTPKEVHKSRDYVLLYDSQENIESIKPNVDVLNRINLDPGGIICTAKARPGSDCDFVSRYFTPQCTVFEDPVTGSAHCSLVPFWAERFGGLRKTFTARQISPRGGILYCELLDDVVLVRGNATTYLTGTIHVPKE